MTSAPATKNPTVETRAFAIISTGLVFFLLLGLGMLFIALPAGLQLIVFIALSAAVAALYAIWLVKR